MGGGGMVGFEGKPEHIKDDQEFQHKGSLGIFRKMMDFFFPPKGIMWANFRELAKCQDPKGVSMRKMRAGGVKKTQ